MSIFDLDKKEQRRQFLGMEAYTGDQLTQYSSPKPLIEGVLYEKDISMLLGQEKSGKSILALQMAMCLSSGTDLFGELAVPEAIPVVYVQTEGKREETARRIERMSKEVPFNRSHFYHLYRRNFPINVEEYKSILIEIMNALPRPPRLIIFDSLYTSMQGDMIDNDVIKNFNYALSAICDPFDAAGLCLHHCTKETFDINTRTFVDKGDKSMYGSVFLRAYVESIIFLKWDPKTKIRTLSCNMSREGNTKLEGGGLKLLLHQPDPLLFDLVGDDAPSVERIRTLIEVCKPATREVLHAKSKLSMKTVDRAIRKLRIAGELTETDTRPTEYKIKENPNGQTP